MSVNSRKYIDATSMKEQIATSAIDLGVVYRHVCVKPPRLNHAKCKSGVSREKFRDYYLAFKRHRVTCGLQVKLRKFSTKKSGQMGS